MGPIRLLWIVPRVGTRAAELLEMPFMLIVVVLAARWISRRFAMPYARLQRLGMGLSALALMLFAEFGFVLKVRGMSFAEYLATRDPVSGTAYYLMLTIFALMPLAVAKE